MLLLQHQHCESCCFGAGKGEETGAESRFAGPEKLLSRQSRNCIRIRIRIHAHAHASSTHPHNPQSPPKKESVHSRDSKRQDL